MHRLATVLTLAIIVTALPNSSEAAITIGFNGFGPDYVMVYDIDTDSATTVSSPSNYLGDIAYDSEQDDVYFSTENGVVEYLWRDNEPTVPGSGSVEKEIEVSGGAQDIFDFGSLDIAPQSQIVYSWRDPRSSSSIFDRWNKIVVRDAATNIENVLYQVPRYSGRFLAHAISGLTVDSVGEWVYFSDSIEGTMNRVRLDGTGGREVLLSGLSAPGKVAADGSNLYWIASDAIWRSDLLGDGATTLITPTNTPYDIDVGDGRIYWTNADGGAVNYSDLSGNNIETLGGNAPHGTLIALAETANVVPEPTSLAMWSVLVGLGLFAARRRRRS